MDDVTDPGRASDGGNGRQPIDAGKLQALLDAVDQLTSTLSLEDLLGHILAIGGKLTGSEAGSVILHDPKRNDLYFAAATGPTAADVKDLRIPVGKGKAGSVFVRRLSLVENALTDHYKALDEKTKFVTHSLVCVPLVFADRCYGVLQLLNKAGGAAPYDKADLELTQRLASQATIAIRNAFLFDRMLASSGLYAAPEQRRDLVPLVTGENPVPIVEHATVMFVDMRGFARFCRTVGNNPTRIQGYLKDFFGTLAEVVLANGGIVNKFLGDGLLAVFRGSDAPARAVQAAFAMHERFAPLREGWQERLSEDISFLDIGVGIASDEITIGAIGDDKISDFTIIGGAVNLAAALERRARDGKRVLCDGPTYRAVAALVAGTAGPETVQLGSSESKFQVYDLRGLRAAAGVGKVFICHAHADVGRVRELIVPRLDKFGFEFFLAESSIPAGELWDKAIGDAIKTSDHFLVVVTKGALTSLPVSHEVHFAFMLEPKKSRSWIMPVLLDEVADTSDIHWQLPRCQYTDLRSGDGIAEFEATLRGLAAGGRRPAGAAGANAAG